EKIFSTRLTNMQSLLYVVSAALACVTHVQVIKPGKCPEFVTKDPFDIPPYLGMWYEITKFANIDQLGTTCNYAVYSDNGDGTVGVHNAGLDAEGNVSEIYGYVEESDIPGRLLLHLNGVPVVGDYNVLDTDYETWTAVYSCGNLLGVSVEQAWILARNSTLTEEQRADVLAAYTKWGIDITHFTDTPQDDCTYGPN
ncbi:unnamed protein product, partial [Meganyctiphanes norvegica]